ncbi:Transcriptional regulator, AbiEi antitoxin, Type IV TA system [Chitinophaga sp. CF118]|uniref:type IV toxin-antitoxin system AbiEi family antitoxin domain-containing protein n=1 Tax=Chitinophaga sp. CF118 TaxID=1884367 RepID=UPI0008F0E44E|nr:hypothetical protein [Chitinophaga sp. CF118]SFE16474.1 Transcriptional regulator, AbiEi antitoxin, Type IV TA system [Chitinophaga sp. CF118]
MNINEAIQFYSSQPLTHQVVLSLLKDYKRPNDKVYELLQKGILESVKKGLYIAGPAIKANRPEPFLLANHIFGPSYVSLDRALSYYGLIPERVYEISSVTVKASQNFITPIGLFSYNHLPLPYYSFGIRRMKLSDEQYALVASPEKALFDKAVTTSGVILRSQKNAINYLLEDLRMNEEYLKEFDTKSMLEWLSDSPKKNSLLMIIKAINSL